MIEIILRGNDAREVLGLLRKHKPRIVFCKAVIDKLTTIKGDLINMILTDTQQVDLAIKPLDSKQQPAQVDGVPVWATSDASIADVVPAADGLSAVVKAGLPGTAQISVSADADLGPGVTTLTGVLPIDVVAGQAATLSIIAGTPVPQV